MTNLDFEPDPDFSQAEAPQGFEFSPDGTVLNVVDAERFLPEMERDVDGLLWLGYLTEDVELYGHRFTIKTITRGERLITHQLVRRYEDSLGLSDAYETAQVAAALVSIDGYPLAEIEPGKDQFNRIKANFELVQRWYDPIISSLFEKVAVLNARQQQALLAFRSK